MRTEEEVDAEAEAQALVQEEPWRRKVPIRNVIYMYSYVWDKVEAEGLKDLSLDDDFDSAEALAELFLVNFVPLLKRGLYKEYREQHEELRGIKGKIDFKESLSRLSFQNAKAVCFYDELNENNKFNQIIKTTAYKLYRSERMSEELRRRLNNVLLKLSGIDIIEIQPTTFDVKFSKNSAYMFLMIKICELINASAMLSEEAGKYRFINIFDDDKTMESVYEAFVYKFYERHLQKTRAGRSQRARVAFQKCLNWSLAGGDQKIIPRMKTDTLIEKSDETIIIDTKYKKSFLSVNERNEAEKRELNSGNMYQMYAYLNHINTEGSKRLRGILLYPKPYSAEEVAEVYEVPVLAQGGMRTASFEFRTIDLSLPWREIEEKLLEIVE